jgi:hypothetical protein
MCITTTLEAQVVVAGLSLRLGVGATTTMYSVVNNVSR